MGNYNGQPAVRQDGAQMKAALPVKNVFWQFLWGQNNAVIWTMRQEYFSQAVMFPYQASKVLEAMNAFYLGNPNPQYNLLVRAVAPANTQLQFTNLGGLWTA